jgi:3-oxoadipate enol-lactonase
VPVARIRGTSIQYRLDGPAGAPALALCNSLGTDLRMWDSVVSALAGRFRVLRHDTRGHGGSAPAQGPYSVELLAGDALAVMDLLDLRRVHLCGLSLGGMVGMWLAARAPERIASLVLCNTSARMAHPEIYEKRIAQVRAGGLGAVVEGALTIWFTPQFRAGHPAEVARAREMILSVSPEGYAGACAAVRDHDARAWLSRVAAPTLVVAGREDAATTPADGRFLAEAIPGARYAELAAAHLSALEAGAALASEIASFLAGREP